VRKDFICNFRILIKTDEVSNKSQHLRTLFKIIGFLFFAIDPTIATAFSPGDPLPSSQGYVFKATHIPPTNLSSSLALGTSTNPAGDHLGATNFYLTWNNKPWLPFMAEFHYARTPSHEWELELKKIKAAGASIISTYCSWIHHEEIQGEWNWREQRNLRKFVRLCAQNNLFVYLRIGPASRREARNGGLPNWVLRKFKPQTLNSDFLELVRQWYAQIFLQIHRLLFSQGGPIIGIEIDNKYFENSADFRKLKQLAIQEGFDVPYYSITGQKYTQFPQTLLSLWRCHLKPPQGNGDTERPDPFIAEDGSYPVGLSSTDSKKPGSWLPAGMPLTTLGIGGGSQTTFRRRLLTEKEGLDALAVTLLGHGANLLGIYPFHGGSHPLGRTSPMHEAGYPKISYDVQAPLSEFGQPRPWYHSLRNFAAFLSTFGSYLAPAFPFPSADSVMKDARNDSRAQCALRASPKGAFLFFHNYDPHHVENPPAGGRVQFDITLPTRRLQFSSSPILKGTAGIWPLNLDLQGILLAWATAQPLYFIENSGSFYCFLKEIPGITPEIALDAQMISRASSPTGINVNKVRNSRFLITCAQPGMNIALTAVNKDGRQVHFVVLSTAQAEKSWQAKVWGRERILISNADFLTWSDTEIRAFRTGAPHVSLSVFPPKETNLSYEKQPEGIFRSCLLRTTPVAIPHSVLTLTPNRWSIHAAVPTQCADVVLRIAYVGSMASLSVRGNTVADNFYNGKIWEISLRRFLPEPLELNIIPLKRTAPIYLPQWPKILGSETQILKYVEALPLYEFCFR